MAKSKEVFNGKKLPFFKQDKHAVERPRSGSTVAATENMQKEQLATPDMPFPENSDINNLMSEENMHNKIPLRGNPLPDIKKNAAKTPLKILFAAAECTPFIATGGLGDVIGSLPAQIADEGADVRVILPLYAEISSEHKSKFSFIGSIQVALSWRKQYCGIFTYNFCGVTYYFIDNEYYFGRKGIYGHYDDGERFTFFSKCIVEILKAVNFIPDIIHCNDWHTAIIPIYLKTLYKEDKIYGKIMSVFTIHNIEYQGKFSEDLTENVFAINKSFYSLVEYQGNINLIKGAVQCSDLVTTVSPNYANEILTPEYSHGLHYILNENKQKVRGILNGIDYEAYNPLTDNALFKNYGESTAELKAENKKGLQKLLNLSQDESIPVLAVISRLVEHKGMDIIAERIDDILKERVQFIILGKGDTYYENLFLEVQKTYSEKLKAVIAFNPDLARKIYGGADILLMPSKSEPCGLSQMIASRYGTVPLVRETGGLADSIKDVGNDGNGFTFKHYSGEIMYNRLKSALIMYQNKEKWNQLVKKCMNTDFSWKKSAKEYMKIYGELLESGRQNNAEIKVNP